MSRETAIGVANDYLTSGAFEADLARRVAIPTESQVPDGLPHTRRYLLEEMAPAFEAMGFTWQIFENPIDFGVGDLNVVLLGDLKLDILANQIFQHPLGFRSWRGVLYPLIELTFQNNRIIDNRNNPIKNLFFSFEYKRYSP